MVRTSLVVLSVLGGESALVDVPIVVLGASGDRADIDAIFRAGASSYEVKPVALVDFCDDVACVLALWLSRVRFWPRRLPGEEPRVSLQPLD